MDNQIILDIILNGDQALGDIEKLKAAINEATKAREALQKVSGNVIDPRQVAEMQRLNNTIEIARNRIRQLTSETDGQNASLRNTLQINGRINQLKAQLLAADKNDLALIEKIKKETAELLEIKKRLNAPVLGSGAEAARLAAEQQEAARRRASSVGRNAEADARAQQLAERQAAAEAARLAA
jgi:chromosome segregation ATPase